MENFVRIFFSKLHYLYFCPDLLGKPKVEVVPGEQSGVGCQGCGGGALGGVQHQALAEEVQGRGVPIVRRMEMYVRIYCNFKNIQGFCGNCMYI